MCGYDRCLPIDLLAEVCNRRWYFEAESDETAVRVVISANHINYLSMYYGQ